MKGFPILRPLEKTLHEVNRRWRGIAKLVRSGPLTLCHGDAKIDNIFFDGKDLDGNICMVDWALAGWNNPMTDFVYFTSRAIDGDNRREWFDELIQFYHSCLAKNGVKNYTLEACQVDAKLYSIIPIIMFLVVIKSQSAAIHGKTGQWAETPTEDDKAAYDKYSKVLNRIVRYCLDVDFEQVLKDHIPVDRWPLCCFCKYMQ